MVCVANDYGDRFRTAYCTVWEKEPLPELFGEMDVVADTLAEMAGKVVAAARSE